MKHSYYSVPDLGLNSRMVHWYDMVMLVVVLGALIYVMPLDFSKGVSITSIVDTTVTEEIVSNSVQTEEETTNIVEEKRQQAIARFEATRVPAGYFKEQFRNGNTLSGNYAYTTDEAGEYIVYQRGYERLEHIDSSMKKSQNLNESKGVIIDHYIIYNKDNKLYFEILNGSTHETDISTDSLIYKDGKPDYEKVCAILLKNEEGEISCIEAAVVVAFIEKGMLIGYYDGVTWFREPNDEESDMLIRYGRDGKIDKKRISKSDIPHMVIKNQYIIFKLNDGRLGFFNIKDNCGIGYILDENEPLSAYTYILDENDNIMIFTASGKYIRKIRPLDNGTDCEFSEAMKNDFSVDMLATVLSTGRGKYLLWCLSEKKSNYYLFAK
ncbi:MAG: hypothetical protein IJO73_03430 [Clostridia bacterium]|nr:hypothetical protein [Clostridia bacterium]